MSAKKSTATKEAEKAASSIAEFKARKKGKSVTLPSGLVVTARRVALRAFLDQGDVPNPLLEVVEEALNKGREMDMNQIVGGDGQKVNLDMVRDMYSMVDKIVMTVVVNPKVHPEPEDENDRDDDLLYVDEVDDEDKMFLFNWSQGGTEDLAKFREEASQDLVSVAKGQGAGAKSKRGTGPRA